MGRSQWSCDGNSFNQVSLCSNLGLMKDLVAGNDDSSHGGPTAIFEHSIVGSSLNHQNGTFFSFVMS